MKKYKVVLEGTSPYMQHRMDDVKLAEWEVKRGQIMERPEVAHEDSVRAEYHSYSQDGNYYMPNTHIKGALIEAGKLVKGKMGGATRSMKNIVAGMFLIYPEQIALPIYDQIDKRSAVNNNVKARIIVIRPKWSKWKVEFTLAVNNETITEQTVREIITYAGEYIGVGSYRPKNSGEFGCFKIAELVQMK